MRTKKRHGETASPLPPAKRANKKSSSHASSPRGKNEKEKSQTLKEKEKLAILKERDLCNTKFAHEESLKDLGVLEGVKTLFDNIGWVKLLEWFDVGYAPTTVEFLSSLYLEEEELHFHLFKKACVLSTNTICRMIDAPTAETFGPNDPTHVDYQAKAFWRSITKEEKYDTGRLKATHIIHPVLRVTHRLLSNIIDSRHDTGNVTQQELYLLWCMIHPQSSRPNFGKYLCHKLLQVSNATKGKICCGSVITILGRHKSLNLRFPQNMGELKGYQYLDMVQLAKMKLFELSERGPGIRWLKGTRRTVYITESNQDILSLESPVEETNWTLDFEDIDSEADVDSEDADTGDDAQDQNEYMARFNTVDTELTSLRAEVVHLRGELTDQRAMLRLMYAHQREMGRTTVSLRDHIERLGSPPPTPPL
ncbi:hypothetical protein HanRHA438_Chr05g0209331 [Helianthus annuus]|uniref:Arabidopsis retrotransposon Orf1 C-terminal domain-containing protein n=2 Tax=Helianthus annuus TaxID=4232 RepID=A0A9K3IWZ7_HELAN|nr:uncharacterized protein LOC110940121 [Helianthus annuus]KAF5804658.1 hypothetical protein HanXRQr2_Chr05g0199651 [Helianthus annuus]KAJ0569238.1 hypothetical protein HanHA300_Chr05g0163821 [Helianthus annuus]KAJ0583546.1 hypothetical protein HanHA89_Chr05g0177851 [Helianthus annuus]KAJ0692100.1 hypothetical protein HanPI659440_Chr15g0582191 [Helianthus annuus]KAJ0746274.1 hypothetical protein HanOQP8_Chr05g0175681 [Helianthus annuus]